ncbi:ribosomal oxygenase 1 [Lingula anatina]|uniref:Bifunctional lysine-specific demethylase and histidyl-hydroxylase n=1 Tax=Lingula anatina TaxID=7574 RepID=A0A1S3H2A1_LINAN|nr:ribosomal oxygenase 1 [Lingula anatina]|eukprot:XP_013379273.1 ribosomal oxygenase 1 [Lingula anatina]
MNPGKKVSAFAVFKAKKAPSEVSQHETSLLSITSMPALSENLKHGKSKEKLSTSFQLEKPQSKKSKEKERKKLEKKFKKLQNGMPTRGSYLPDTAINSPLADLSSAFGSQVSLRSGKKDKLPPKPPKPPKPKSLQAKLKSPKSPKSQETTSPKFKSPKSKVSDGKVVSPKGKHSLEENLVSEVKGEQPSKRRKVSHATLPEAEKQTPVTPFKQPPAAAAASKDLPYMYDSTVEATRLFDCLIHPVKPKKFFSELWEKKPLLVKRHMPCYNDGWFSTEELDKILRKENIIFGKNIDVTTYSNGKRETHNPPGRAYAPIVWDYFQNGCSVRLLNPQTYSHNVWKFLSVLQEYFGCMVGANIYLTPAGSQGFAPHWDDIEAFVLQLEGKKHWRLYSPRNDGEVLARYSSGNFTSADVGEPILDVMLEPGDLLYFPRGVIHQADTPTDSHSLHVTVSTFQQNSWGDLMEQIVPTALQLAIEEDLEFRKGLPRDYLSYMGVVNQDSDNPERKAFLRKIEQLMTKLLSYAPVDAACDQMGKKCVHDSLPPVLTKAEEMCSIHGNGERWDTKLNTVRGAVELEPDTPIKIIRKGVLRLVGEEDQVRIYYTLENARLYHDTEPKFFEISADAAPAVEHLIFAYPDFVTVDSLPMKTLPEKTEIANALYEKGLLMTDEPMQAVDDSSSEDEDI